MRIIAAILLALISAIAHASDETTLFDGRGRAVAYVADDLTIYLWSGKPIAYLDRDSGSGFHVYGFNGKHLGWFSRGIVRDHEGNGTCAVMDALSSSTETEPTKSTKETKPTQSTMETAPTRPTFSNSWSKTPCGVFIQAGAS